MEFTDSPKSDKKRGEIYWWNTASPDIKKYVTQTHYVKLKQIQFLKICPNVNSPFKNCEISLNSNPNEPVLNYISLGTKDNMSMLISLIRWLKNYNT